MKAEDLFEKVTADLIASDRGRGEGLAHAVASSRRRWSVQQRRRSRVPRVECAGAGDIRRRSRVDVVDLGDLQRMEAWPSQHELRAAFAATNPARRHFIPPCLRARRANYRTYSEG